MSADRTRRAVSMRTIAERCQVSRSAVSQILFIDVLTNLYTTTLTANTTIANPINLVSGKKFQIEVIQGGTGSYTVTWGSLFAWPAATAPTLSTTVGYVDLITCTYDGTKLRCFAYLHVA